MRDTKASTEFFGSPLCNEIMALLTPANVAIPGWVIESGYGPCLCLDGSRPGRCTLSVRAQEGSSEILQITGVQLLEKLRRVKGQFTFIGAPVFY